MTPEVLAMAIIAERLSTGEVAPIDVDRAAKLARQLVRWGSCPETVDTAARVLDIAKGLAP